MKNIELFEHIFSLKSSGTSKQLVEIDSDAMCENVRRKRPRKETTFGDDCYTYLVENDQTFRSC